MKAHRILAGTLAILLIARINEAQTGRSKIAELSAQLDGAVAAKAEAMAVVNYVAQTGAPIRKELNLWDEQLKSLEGAIQLRDAKLKAHKEDAAIVNEKVFAHNRACTGEVPKAVYDRCKGEEAYLQPQINRVNSNKKQLEDEAAALKRRGDPIIERHRVLSDKMDKLRADLAKAEIKLADAQTRIEKLTGLLKSECQNNPTREAQVHCGQVNWDGTPKVLPPPPDDPIDFGAIDFGRRTVPAQPLAGAK